MYLVASGRVAQCVVVLHQPLPREPAMSLLSCAHKRVSNCSANLPEGHAVLQSHLRARAAARRRAPHLVCPSGCSLICCSHRMPSSCRSCCCSMAVPLHTLIKVVACVVLAFPMGQAALQIGPDPNCKNTPEAISTDGDVSCGSLVGGDYPVKAVLIHIDDDDSGLSTAQVLLFETASCKGRPAATLQMSGAQCGITNHPFKSFSISHHG